MTVTGSRHARSLSGHELLDAAKRIGAEVAAPSASEVDASGRFPHETIEACSEAGLLGSLVPHDLGGSGATISQVGESVAAIARHCASSAMILAMHHLQVACLVRHGRTAALNRYVADVAELQLLLASATTEVHIGGRLRASSCALLPAASGFVLEKDAPVVSYGSYADAILVTARRTPHSAEGDQVLVVCPAASTKLEQRSEWDALGMRGTCSHGYRIAAEGPLDHVLADPFADIAEQTMLPAAHVLWGYVWLGVAAAATTKARRHVQAQARKHPGSTPAGSTRMAELMVAFRTLEAVVEAAACRYEATPTGRQPKLAGSIAYNGVKVAASQAVVEIVTQAMSLCGIAGYQEGTPYSLGRHLRDAHGSVVMVSNERILGDNAHLLLGDREEI